MRKLLPLDAVDLAELASVIDSRDYDAACVEPAGDSADVPAETFLTIVLSSPAPR